MRFRLIPREEKFYADFIALADELMVGARTAREDALDRTAPVGECRGHPGGRARCDTITHEVFQRLNRTFVTPIDREDIHGLARSLDDVMDAIDASAARHPPLPDSRRALRRP